MLNFEVQRSSVSHILSRRNKPSLDFLIKITDFFPETSLSELVYGEKPHKPPHSIIRTDPEALNDPEISNTQLAVKPSHGQTKKTEKSLIMLYSDGTFEKYDLKS